MLVERANISVMCRRKVFAGVITKVLLAWMVSDIKISRFDLVAGIKIAHFE